MSEFKVGDLVEWTSQSAGTVKTKRGEVADVVLPGFVALGIRNRGTRRDHVSYVVKVGSRRYWPRVMHLRRVE